VALPRNHPLAHHKVVSRDDLAREQLLLIEDGHCLRSHSLQACRIVNPVRNEVFQATSLRTLVQMVAANLGITLMPQIAVDSELASTRNVVIRSLSPDKPYRTLVLAWHLRLTRTLKHSQRAKPADQVAIHCGDVCQERRTLFIDLRG
jgi:LysR family hydrogen peroxide-inducible transcriptional activator